MWRIMEISKGVIRLGPTPYTLLDLHNSLYDDQPHSLVVKYNFWLKNEVLLSKDLSAWKDIEACLGKKETFKRICRKLTWLMRTLSCQICRKFILSGVPQHWEHLHAVKWRGFLYLKIGKVCYSRELIIKCPHLRGLSVRINRFWLYLEKIY